MRPVPPPNHPPIPAQTHPNPESHCCWETTRVRFIGVTADRPQMPLARDVLTGQLGWPLSAPTDITGLGESRGTTARESCFKGGVHRVSAQGAWLWAANAGAGGIETGLRPPHFAVCWPKGLLTPIPAAARRIPQLPLLHSAPPSGSLWPLYPGEETWSWWPVSGSAKIQLRLLSGPSI